MKKNCVIVAAGLGLVQLALLSTAARAQDTVRTLNGVEVTATRSPKKLAETGRVVTIISAADIARAQGQTLPQLLNTVAGITFSGANNAPGISSSLYLRGESTGNALVLIDGFPVNNASSIDNSYDLNAFPLDQIDHIEILKGSGSTLYGSDAVAGVINIITKHAAGQGLKTNVQLQGGSYNTFKESAAAIGNLGKTGLAVNLSNTDSKGFAGATDTTGKGNFRKDDFHQRALCVNINQPLSSNFTLNGNFQATRNTGNLPYAAFTDDPAYTYGNTFLFGGIGGKLKLDKGSLLINITQNDVWNNYNDAAGAANGDFGTYQKNTGRITDAEAVFAYSPNKYLDITSGIDYKYFNTDQYSTFDTIRSGKASNSIGSIYTSLFFKAGIFHLELGGRYNHDHNYGNNFTYTVNPSVILFNQLKVFATVASAYKSPSLYQLFSQYGNTTLKPETTTSYEAGFDESIIPNALSFSTVFYQYKTTSVIYFEGLPNPPYGVYANGELQKDHGFENELKFRNRDLTVSAYYAYVTGALTDQSGATTNNLYRRPKDTFGASVFYDFTNHFTAGLNYKYTGDRTDEAFNSITFASSVVTLKAYSLLDAHLQYVFDSHVSIFADLKNLLDEKYTDWIGYNTMRFNFMIGAKYQF